MTVQFDVTYYSIVMPDGTILAPYQATHSGLYEIEKSAARYLNSELRHAIQLSIPPKDPSVAITRNCNEWALHAEVLRNAKIVPIRIGRFNEST